MTPKQISLSMQHDAGFERYRKPARRDVFLAEMDQVVPWAELCAVIAPHYPKGPEPVLAAVAGLGWSGCCASTFCGIGMRSRIRRSKKHCTTRPRCAGS
jgi:hypothetical protein